MKFFYICIIQFIIIDFCYCQDLDFEISEKIKDAINNNNTESEVLKIAQSESFKTMKDIAQSLVNEGLTTPSEILREIST